MLELGYDELEEYLLEIFTASRNVRFVEDDLELNLFFKHPDNVVKMKALTIYKSSYANAINEGLLPISELEKLMEQRGLYTVEDKDKLDKLESQLYAQQILLSKTTKVQLNQDRIRKVIQNIKTEIGKIRIKKYSKMMLSAEAKADEDKAAYLCRACTYRENGTLFWSDYNDYLKDSNLILRQAILASFLKFNGGISTNIIRFIARSNLWRIRYITSLKTSEPLFGVSTSQYTNDMLNLAYWSNFYQSIYEMMPEDRPPDSIIDDDDALDVYMKDYYEERTREDASRRGKKQTKGRLSAFDKEEVIVTQSHDLYQDIKYDTPREAQKIRDRVDIKKKTQRLR